jgi:hypothetical protein
MNPIDRAGDAARSVGGYISNVARSIRDVPTAVGTALDSKGAQARGERFAQTNPKATPGQVRSMSTQPLKNIATQVGQVATSIAGKKDTNRSDQYAGKNKAYISVDESPKATSSIFNK